MLGKGEAQPERHWPKADGEAEARHKNPADWQRYDFAAVRVAGHHVLDCACGSGYGTGLLAKAGAVRVVGVDVAADALDWARREFSCSSAEFRHAGADAFPVSDGEFDFVVSFETIEHLAEPSAPKFVAELARALRPGGTLILSTPITYGPARFHPENPYHLREYTPAELEELLTGHFVIDERLGQHSQASRRFADLARTPGIGSLIRRGVHRLIPGTIRKVVRDALFGMSSSKNDCWIAAERWQEASVQIIVARKK